MPQRSHQSGSSLIRLVFLAAALALLSATVRRERSRLQETSRERRRKIRLAPRRVAASLAFVTLFFAGAAFSAGAGDKVATFMDPASQSASPGDTTTTTTTTTSTDQAAASSAPTEPQAPTAPDQPADTQPPADPAPAPADAQQPQAAPAVDPQATPAPASPTAGVVQAKVDQRARVGLVLNKAKTQLAGAKLHRGGSANEFHSAPPVLKPQPKLLRAVTREPEVDQPNVAATIWLQRALPDPTPPSRRLTPAFARRLVRVAKQNHVDWALELAVLRASGERGAAPAGRGRLLYLSKQLASRHAQRNAWTSVLALEGRTTFADRTIALQNLYHAVGLRALVKGFDWAKPSLSKRILNDPRITIYPGGRSDIESGRVNIRVLVLIAYLAEAHGQVTVSCLISGHGLYARPGVISAHIYGLAADISTLGNTTIFGHQQPGGITEQAVRNILLLPAEMQPRQVISLLGLGGPSFPLADHYDHIHVGY
jgi:hypothetical protein